MDEIRLDEAEDSFDEDDSDNNGPIEEFDRDLPTTHSYLPGGLTMMRGRSVLEPGWEGQLPCWCHHSVVFPGESVPMHYPDVTHLGVEMQFIHARRLFGLIFPEKLLMSDYGVLCEVIEATELEDDDNVRVEISLKAQATQRFRLMNSKRRRLLQHRNMFLNKCDVKILPDIVCADPLKDDKLFSIMRQNLNKSLKRRLQKADSVLTPWPPFLFDIFNIERITERIKTYFRQMSIFSLPEDPLSMSFWVASNLTMSIQERLNLFIVDNALLRLYMELQFLNKYMTLCCSECSAQICDLEEIFAMSNEGIHTNYCNVGGYVHDVVTVKNTTNVKLHGRRSMEFTWFPGYYWTVAVCSSCFSHVGWKFTADKKSLRPQSFWGLTRNSITPKQR